MKKARTISLYIIYAAIITVIAVIIMRLTANSGVYPSGSDTMYHVYRGQYVYESVSKGTWYPLLNPFWYNGVELMRYWPPLTAYIMAFFDMLAKGDIFTGYIYYVGFVFIGGALSWSYIGARLRRNVFGCALGVLWFFIPNNLYALFGEGNLPRALSMIFLPLLIFHIYEYYEKNRALDLLGISIMMALMSLCHLGYAGMVALAIILYMICYLIINTKKLIPTFRILIAVLLGFLLTGLYLIPSLKGGMTSSDNSGKGKLFFQSLKLALNPFYRLHNMDVFYFGFAILVLIIFGLFGSHKKQMSGFITALIILLATSKSAYYIIRLLPGSDFLWMVRFISIAICFALMSFLYWTSLKRYVIVLLCLLMAADSIPSLGFIYGDRSGYSPYERLDYMADTTLIKEAKDITDQRLALMDLSTLSADGAYLTSTYGGETLTMFGAGWEAAVTSTNITQANYALEQGYYPYLFDRLKDLGNDTVLFRKANMPMMYSEDIDYNIVMDAATRSGYELYDENGGYMLFKLPVDSPSWGTHTSYKGIAIGSSANTLALVYPSIEETDDTNINHYSYEELKDYEFVFLSGFTYDDKASAEDMIRKLSDQGIRFVIVGDTIPEDKKQRIQSFLGVSCQVITFNNGYPMLYADSQGWMDTDLFPQEYTVWQTHYLNGLDKCYGYFMDNDIRLEYYGTVYNDNIYFVGLNLPYYLSLSQDDSITAFMEDVFRLPHGRVPDREVVPLEISYEPDKLVIKSSADGVNTSISYHDIYSGTGFSRRNNLLHVDKGETVIGLSYPYLKQGLAVTLAAIVGLAAYIVICKKREDLVDGVRSDRHEQQG